MPTLITTQDSTNASDSTIDSSAATTNFNTDTNFYAGKAGGQTTRSILKFPEISTIPSGSTIVSASLDLWIDTTFASNSTVQFYQVRPARDVVMTQVTYTIWKTANSWSTLGAGDTSNDIFSTHDDLSVTTSDTGGTQKTLTVTPANISLWVNGQANNGWLIRTAAESGTDQGAFKSGNNATSGQRPRLTVVYTLSNTSDTQGYFLA